MFSKLVAFLQHEKGAMGQFVTTFPGWRTIMCWVVSTVVSLYVGNKTENNATQTHAAVNTTRTCSALDGGPNLLQDQRILGPLLGST